MSLIGYVTYGCDRFLDSMEYYEKNKDVEVDDKKEVLYKFMHENRYDVLKGLFLSYFLLDLFFKKW